MQALVNEFWLCLTTVRLISQVSHVNLWFDHYRLYKYDLENILLLKYYHYRSVRGFSKQRKTRIQQCQSINKLKNSTKLCKIGLHQQAETKLIYMVPLWWPYKIKCFYIIKKNVLLVQPPQKNILCAFCFSKNLEIWFRPLF